MSGQDLIRVFSRASLVRPTAVLALVALLAGCSPFSAAQFNDDLFVKHEIMIETANNQTVLAGHLLGGAIADLAVVHVDVHDDRRLRIYSFTGDTWLPTLDATLRPGVLFVDVVNIGGQDRLITIESGRVNWFDPETAAERLLMEIDVSVSAADTVAISRVNISRDVNSDGRDDLVVPDIDGFWVSTQSSNGSFTDPAKLGPPEPFLDEIAPEDTRRYGEVGITAMTIPWYLSRVHQLDHDGDGRNDLVFWNEDHFDVYHQNELGRFDREAETFKTAVQFDSDGVYSHMFGFSGESEFSLIFGTRAKSKRTVLHSMRDMNGDGVADLVTSSLEGRSALKQRSELAVHFGTSTGGGLEFAKEASATIPPRGATVVGYQAYELRDLDGDGQVEITHALVDTGIGKMVRAMVGNSITMNLAFFRMKDGAYPEEPDATRRVRPGIHVFDTRGPFFPTVLGGDVDGDGRTDLLVGQDWDELRVYLGVPGPGLFAQRPQKVEVELPANESNAWLVDFNRDGREDILVHRPSTTKPHRVTVLIARSADPEANEIRE